MTEHPWILVTGGVSSGVGKGTCAAVLGRLLARAGRRVHYQKLEPNLATRIAGLDHHQCGEIVHRGEAVFAVDVARFAFYVPGYIPSARADTTLGQLLAEQVEQAARTRAPSARLQLHEALRTLAESWPSGAITLVELGGTVGEPEHERILAALGPALGAPTLHVHVTQLLTAADGRVTTKPAQLALERLARPVDLVVVRSPPAPPSLGALAALVDRGTPIVAVGKGPWPERTFHEALVMGASTLLRSRLGVTLRPDLLLEAPVGPPQPVTIVHDGAGPEGYASLERRLHAWSRGRVKAVWTTQAPESSLEAVIRIGEASPASPLACAPRLDIVPIETGAGPRDEAGRPDWWGTADAPVGPIAEFLATPPQHPWGAGGRRQGEAKLQRLRTR